MVPFWVPNIVRHLIFRVPKRDHNFDNHPISLGFVGFRVFSFGVRALGLEFSVFELGLWVQAMLCFDLLFLTVPHRALL